MRHLGTSYPHTHTISVRLDCSDKIVVRTCTRTRHVKNRSADSMYVLCVLQSSIARADKVRIETMDLKLKIIS